MKFKLKHLSILKLLQRKSQALSKIAMGFTFLLYGNLGTGKTTLVREILKNLGGRKPVKSPTFSIVEEYLLQIKIFITLTYID